jgi:hypothetical protein
MQNSSIAQENHGEELDNLKKMIHEAEVKKRMDSVRDPTLKSINKSPEQRKHERTVNLHINNFKVSFRQLGALVV